MPCHGQSLLTCAVCMLRLRQASSIWGDAEHGPEAEAVMDLAEVASGHSFVTSPVIDMLQNTQDRLFCRLFSS